ncbi:hypothetical protein GAYE_HPESCF16G0197 [Galdieria yellowstonensis]|uniref:Uncharacterized protein n=1 Tax=Galdieria yellowstonensis TaxID=3028027 RepID=A0AAV9I335_9RHOD|nr:hypothetical protein GAYE_HPESCF16G0197 [Galdieria yellowstonensis]
MWWRYGLRPSFTKHTTQKIVTRNVSLDACAETETDKVVFRQKLRQVRRNLAAAYLGKRYDGVKPKPKEELTQQDLYYRWAPITKKRFVVKPFTPEYSLLGPEHYERERGLHMNDFNIKMEQKRKEIAEKLARESPTWVTRENLDRKVESVLSALLDN